MTYLWYDLSRPDYSLEDAYTLTFFANVCISWHLCAGAFKGKQWDAYCIPDWNVQWGGGAPNYTGPIYIWQSDTRTAIKIDLTYDAGNIDTFTISYKQEDDSFTAIGPITNAPPAKDAQAAAPLSDYRRPGPTHIPGSATPLTDNPDDWQIRRNWVNRLAACIFRSLREKEYALPGFSISVTTIDGAAGSDPIEIIASVSTSNAKFKYSFTYYALNAFGDGARRLETAEIAYSRNWPTEDYYIIDKLSYLRRGNGTISRIIQLGGQLDPSNPL